MTRRVAMVLLLLFAVTPCWGGSAPARVIVLATLHGLHDKVPAYGFDVLGRTIERLQPDVLCLEVQPADLELRSPERVKQEYPRTIYPLADRHHYKLYAMEPAEPLFSRIVKPYIAATQVFQARHAAQAEAFGAYADRGLDVLVAYWATPARVNDAVTDAVLAAKHALQQALIGPGERVGWQAWNRHFLDVIVRAARENPGRRIVVTVGVEHAYWLRGQLRGKPGIVLEDTGRLLAAE